jgi:hypothetical protein
MSDPGPDPAAQSPGQPGGRSGQAVLVAFADPDEFLKEIAERPPNVDGVLRLSFRWQRDDADAPVAELWLVANYLHRLDADTLTIVRLDRRVGGVWWSGLNDAASAETRQRAEALRGRIRSAAEARGVEVRGGSLRDAPPAGPPGPAEGEPR